MMSSEKKDQNTHDPDTIEVTPDEVIANRPQKVLQMHKLPKRPPTQTLNTNKEPPKALQAPNPASPEKEKKRAAKSSVSKLTSPKRVRISEHTSTASGPNESDHDEEEQDVASSEALVTKLRKRINDQQKMMQMLDRQVKNARDSEENFRGQLDAARELEENLRNQLHGAAELEACVAKENTVLDRRYRNKTKEAKDKDATIKSLKEELISQSEACSKLRESLTQLQEKQETQNALQDLMNLSAPEVATLQANITLLKERDKELAEARAELKKSEEAISLCDKEVRDHQAKLEQFKEQFNDADQTLTSTQQKLKDRTTLLEQQVQQNHELHSKLSDSEDQVDVLKVQVEKLQEKLDDTEKQIAVSKQASREVGLNLQTSIGSNKKLRAEVEQLTADKRNLQKRIDEVQSQLQRMRDHGEKARVETKRRFDKLREQVGNGKKIFSQIENSLATTD